MNSVDYIFHKALKYFRVLPYMELKEIKTIIRKIMKVVTKFNIGDTVWHMYRNRPMSNQVRYVYIRVTGKGQYSISYLVRDESTERAEETLFSSKQELLSTL